MNKDAYPNDDTILVDHDDNPPSPEALTGPDPSSRFDELEAYYVQSAAEGRLQPYTISPNPLVAAAAELLSEVARLKRRKRCKDLGKLNKRLNNDIKAFERRTRLAGVEHYEVQTARYLLCTVVDEAVLTSEWGKHSDWPSRSLLSHFHNETSGGEKFFLLAERVLKRPLRHLHMLELMYLCLALGFQGKYAMGANGGSAELEDVRDELYRHIRRLRGDAPLELSPQWQGLRHVQGPTQRSAPSWLVALLTLISLGAVYSGFAWVLSEQRERVLLPFQSSAIPDAAQPTTPEK